jgi:uncharacterized protein YgbK (DUF1537 family)
LPSRWRCRVSKFVEAEAHVIALTTESRHLPSEQAAQRVATAIAALQSLRPAMIFKKIDSILRGNVGAEIVAALRATGCRHAFISPAIPNQKRVMREGTVYLNGAPVPTRRAGPADSEVPQIAHLPDLLAETGELTIHQCSGVRFQTLAAGPGLHAYVVDTETEEDLDALARFVVEHSGDVLPVGTSGLGRALARVMASSSSGYPPNRSLNKAPDVLLYVVGSRSHTSSEQVSALLRAGAEEISVPVAVGEYANALIERRLNDLKEPAILVLQPESTEVTSTRALEVAERLGLAASVILRRFKSPAIAMAGGDTAAACLAAINAERLHVEGELHQGIAVGTVGGKGSTIHFCAKSGSFGPPDTWVRLAEQLQAGGHLTRRPRSIGDQAV